MSERAAFINAILDNPSDDTARLVFADWLEEHGEPERAEFIRVQIEADKLPGAAHEKSVPGKRADELLQAHQKAWRGAVGFGPAHGRYERGFLERVGIRIYDFDGAESALAVEPVFFALECPGVDLRNQPIPIEQVETLQNSPFMRAVIQLGPFTDGYDNFFGADRFARLLRSPHLTNVRGIDLGDHPLGAEFIRAIARAPAPFILEELVLSAALAGTDDGGDPDQAVRFLATEPRFASLLYLDLGLNSLTDKHIRILLRSKTLSRTLHLELSDNEFDEERFAEALAERFTGGSD